MSGRDTDPRAGGRLDLVAVHLVRARNRLRAAGAPARIACRRAAPGAAARVAALPDAVVLALDDPARAGRAALLAAAAYCGDGVARAISGPARTALAGHLDDTARAFALRHRPIRPQPIGAILSPEALIDTLTVARAQAAALLQSHRPGAAPLADQDHRMSQCLTLALFEAATP